VGAGGGLQGLPPARGDPPYGAVRVYTTV